MKYINNQGKYLNVEFNCLNIKISNINGVNLFYLFGQLKNDQVFYR